MCDLDYSPQHYIRQLIAPVHRWTGGLYGSNVFSAANGFRSQDFDVDYEDRLTWQLPRWLGWRTGASEKGSMSNRPMDELRWETGNSMADSAME